MTYGIWIAALVGVVLIAAFVVFRNRNREYVPATFDDLHDEARQLGRTLSEVFLAVESKLKVGLSTQEIDAIVTEEVERHGVQASFFGYNDFPSRCTTSVNNEVINTPPSARVLEEGDLLKLQIGLRGANTFAMQGWTYAIGEATSNDLSLCRTAQEALDRAVETATSQSRTGDISAAIQGHLEAAGYSVNRDFIGHGVGRTQHRDPPIHGNGRVGTGPRLRSGMILSLNVIAHAGAPDVEILDDEWTTVSLDGKNSVQFSKMVIVGEAGAEALTSSRTSSPP
jgi:methionyl aminopeptidase